jgi:prepilin-type N-terminal cleavage/methylation domain-containing protein
MKRRPTYSGFTIVELLIVIVVIAILAAITIVAFNGVNARAQDSKRAQDVSSIKKALTAYEIVNGGVPRTTGSSYTGGVTYSGWDASISPNWLAFLRADHGQMPIDPVNTITGTNPPAGGNFTYFYYCYSAGSGPLPATDNVVVGYHKSDGTSMTSNYAVSACL